MYSTGMLVTECYLFVRAGLVEDVSDIWSDTGWVDGNLTEGMSHDQKTNDNWW